MKIALLTLLTLTPFLSAQPALAAGFPTQEPSAPNQSQQNSDLEVKLQKFTTQLYERNIQLENLKAENARLQKRLDAVEQYSPLKEEHLGSAIFQAKHIRGDELVDLASQVFGDSVNFIPTGSPIAVGYLTDRRRFTAFSNGKQIIVTEFPDQMEKALVLLASLDIGLDVQATETEQEVAPQVVLYTPKALAPEQVLALLQAENPDDLHVTPVHRTETLRLEGSASSIKDALERLKLTDCYAPQVRIKGYLVQATTEAPGHSNVTLPDALVSGLKGALPGQHFAGIASLFLQSSAGQGQRIETRTSPRAKAGDLEVSDWRLAARMRSYDSEEGLLSLNECTFHVTIPNGLGTGVNVEQLSVDLMLRKDEYTVVGSILGGSMYLVLSFEEI